MGVLTRLIIGGDEFVILLEGISGIEKAIQITERILKDFQTPLILNDSEVVISTSIGIVLEVV
ncbi:diguanylate cyclase domain-containing protein [Nostoc sp.]|uniref:diguanylate cyclase domain-containing protein n=1 Tax=Nostoc sp. TaxID=1180 RepID=UPI002FFAA4B8